ncbi:MAG: hypothetical protein LBF72_03175 [Holosporales bacterium]|nr:hypothetical protein [Holosporales bacterium]
MFFVEYVVHSVDFFWLVCSKRLRQEIHSTGAGSSQVCRSSHPTTSQTGWFFAASDIIV